jgi:carboxymethylenebutenolidase
MSYISPKQIPQQAFDWHDDYAHGEIDRRIFLSRLGSLSVVGLTLGAVTSALTPNYALAQKVSFNDGEIKATYQEFESPNGHGKGRGYWVAPSNINSKAQTVLVVHENRELNPYVRDVARRLAKQGYIAFAPDALFPLGGYLGNDDDGRTMQRSMENVKIKEDFKAAANYLKRHESSTGKLGVVGFCSGGYVSNILAAIAPHLIDAAVPFYGTPAKGDLVKNVKAPIMIQFAENDKRVNATWPDYEAALKANNVNYTAHFYPNTQHGFHNDSTSRYDPKAAELAWSRTLAFFKQHLA